MNERIKEIMGKTLDSEFSHTWDTMTYEGLQQFSEKFSELIVLECARWLSNREFASPEALKQHFGVK